MTFHLYEDCWETTTTTGSGNISLGGAVTGWRSFASQYSNGDTLYYSIYDGINFEHGLGTYVTAGNQIARTTVYRSTNANAAVNWSAGIRQIVCAPLGVAIEQLCGLGATGYPKLTSANAWTFDTAGQISNTTATNDAASVGNLGEYFSQTVLVGSAIALSSTISADVASFTVGSGAQLSAGDWDISFTSVFAVTGSGSATSLRSWVSTTSATQPVLPNSGMMARHDGTFTAIATWTQTAVGRLSLSAASNVYLSADATFSGPAVAVYGFLSARRAR